MPKIDLQFAIYGETIPADHGYHLLSSISKIIDSAHGDDTIGIHPISGIPIGNRMLSLNKKSKLTFRLDVDRIKEFLSLGGKTLVINGNKIQVGVPKSNALIPSARLYSRLVIIKGFMEPESFLKAAQKQLKEMKIEGKPYLIKQPEIAEANKDKKSGTHSPYLRRTIRIRNKEIVGFAMGIEQLTAEESILVQENGIGGRRRFGCGIFIPDRK